MCHPLLLFSPKVLHLLIFNNLRKGSNQVSSLGVHHGLAICSKIESKIICNKTFSIINSIVSVLSLIIIDLVIIIMERTHKNGGIK
jgi:hypothetical protein